MNIMDEVEDIPEKKPLKPFEFINSISKTKVDLMLGDESAKQAYPPYVVNRGLSMHQDTILYANEMNMCYNLDTDMQYYYYFYSIKKRSRYMKWLKKQDKDPDIEAVQAYYGCNKDIAETYISILSKDELENINKSITAKLL